MTRLPWHRLAVISILLLVPVVLCGSTAAAEPDYSITYTITISQDGSALWGVEYRTLLPSEKEVSDFEGYARDLPTVYLPQFHELIEKSAAQAAVATSRHMDVSDFSADSVVQTSPTGRYGVVLYSFAWTGFAEPGNGLTAGDVFAGGLYLPRDATLVMRYPPGFSVISADPPPDEVRNGLVWYGLRSFGAGEPRVVLERASFPVIPVAIGLVIILAAAAFTGYVLVKRRREKPGTPKMEIPSLSGTEMKDLEERILILLAEHGGELSQPEIIRRLGLPKSTVGTALNELGQRGLIHKVKKGRENLIRRT
ncbi:MAG: MarR family transcriptional regulator [Methanoregula sp.]|nr:MAG: MarR family transcriptional regulator [Methanoregula sp.]